MVLLKIFSYVYAAFVVQGPNPFRRMLDWLVSLRINQPYRTATPPDKAMGAEK